MIINKYNNGGGGSSSSTTYAQSAATSLSAELLEGQAAFPQNPSDGDVVAIKEAAPTRGTKSASIEKGVYQYSSSDSEWNKLGEGGGVDSGVVQTQIDESISGLTENLESGDLMVGMAEQLYSPDGVTSDGLYSYRTTAGDKDVATGDAELRVLKGNSDYSNVVTSYGADAALYRNGEEVTGFTYDITTGDVQTAQWVSVGRAENVTGYSSTTARIKTITNNVTGFWHFKDSDNDDIGIMWNNQEWSTVWNSRCQKVDATHFAFDNGNGQLVIEDGYVVGTITGGSAVWKEIFVDDATQYLPDNPYEIWAEATVDNDIPDGTSTYTYDSGSWSPELPQAVLSMELNSETYVPDDGDELVITKSVSAEGNAVHPNPSEFVSLGLNSFDYTASGLLTTKVEDYSISYDDNEDAYKIVENQGYGLFFIKAVTGLENGYIIYSINGNADPIPGISATNDENAEVDFSGTVELSAAHKYVVYPTAEKPYIVFSSVLDYVDGACVHPRWSGKMDDAFEEYSESTISLSGLAQYPLCSVGEFRNEIDLKNGVFKEYVRVEEFDSDKINYYINEEGKGLGIDLAYDEDYIYVAGDEPREISISANYAYKDNDFGVEYFVEDGEIMPQPVYAENFYITNLVDKLRRMEMDFIHLDDPNTEGQVGKVYEYQGRLMKWVEGSGYTAEWLKQIDQTEDDEGTGLIYSTIPDGTVLFEFRRTWYGNFRNIVYSANTLYLTETAGTVVCAVTVGNTFKFDSQNSSSYYLKGRFDNGHIGFTKTSNAQFQNFWDRKAEGGHYELLDKHNYPYVVATDGANRTCKFNENGQVVKAGYTVSTRDLYFNTSGTSTSYKTQMLTTGTGNGPARIFVPSVGGTQGQILQSNGSNSEPSWINWIRVVKITSTDYEALVQAGTTDPSVLYAIDDSNAV